MPRRIRVEAAHRPCWLAVSGAPAGLAATHLACTRWWNAQQHLAAGPTTQASLTTLVGGTKGA